MGRKVSEQPLSLAREKTLQVNQIRDTKERTELKLPALISRHLINECVSLTIRITVNSSEIQQ